MAKKQTTTPMQITSRWDRPAVAIGKGETYLVVTIGTPKIKRGPGRSPVDVAFVIDRSGSMSGPPLELAKRGVIEALGMLNDDDAFAVVAYDNAITDVCPLIPASGANRNHVTAILRDMASGGSTDLFGGWRRGAEHLRAPFQTEPANGRPRIKRTILLTDGQANVGLVDPAQISSCVTHERQYRTITSTLGLGTGIDEDLLSGMAEAGSGNFAFVQHSRDLPAFFMKELGEALTVIASGTTLELTLPKGVRARLLNPFPVEREGKTLTIALGDIPAGMTLNLVFEITTRAMAETPYPALHLIAEWGTSFVGATGMILREQMDIPVDTLMVVSRKDFKTMPRDPEASTSVAELLAVEAKRAAVKHYRAGDSTAARAVLFSAQQMVQSAPSVRRGLSEEIDLMVAMEPDSAEFEVQRRQIVNNEHRRSRGRDL